MTATNENKYTHQPPATAEELAKQILLIGVRYSFKTEGTIAHAEEAKKEVAALITAHVAQVTAEWQLQADLAEPTIKSLSNEVAVLCTICAKQKEALILGDAIVIAQALALTPATVADELATLQKRLHAAGESCSNYIAEINSLGDELAAKDKRIAELEADDPVKFWLNVMGWFLVLGGIAVWFLSNWVKLFANPKIDSMCGAAICFGFILWGIAYYIRPIRIVGVCCAIGLAIAYAIYYATHRSIVSSLPQPGAGTQPTPASGGDK